MTDEDYMRSALKLAEEGIGRVNPNPLVGALLVKRGLVIGEGYHRGFGERHAEVDALLSCSESPRGATLYVTLEPCCHLGKTPPCTDAILESGVTRVVIGSRDPNPLVSGKGLGILQEHGVEITEGVLKEECDRMNRVFLHFIRKKTPYVVMKYAMTMDGKIAASSGKSKWITGEPARVRVHEDRGRYSAIMVGVGTILADDPLLTCRVSNGVNPIRIVCDSSLRTPLAARVVATTDQARTIIATCRDDSEGHLPYQRAGCEVLVVRPREGRVDLRALMEELGIRSVDSVLLEGGGALNWSALEAGIVNVVQVYVAPKLFGGAISKSPIEGAGVLCPSEAYQLSPPVVSVFGEDILLESELIPCSQES